MLKENPPYVEGSRMMYRGQVCKIIHPNKTFDIGIKILHTEEYLYVPAKELCGIPFTKLNKEYYFPNMPKSLEVLLNYVDDTYCLDIPRPSKDFDYLPIHWIHNMDVLVSAYKLLEYEKNITDEEIHN